MNSTSIKCLRYFSTGRFGVVPVLFFSLIHAVDAQQQDPSLKLREQLRATLLQLRSAQTESANAIAAQAAADAKNTELAGKLETLEKRIENLAKEINLEKESSEKSIAALNNKVLEREKRLVLFSEALEKWKTGYEKAAEIARATEGERSRLASEIVIHQRTIADRESKNISLFNTSMEILDRYEGYALGKALGAREPFIGNTRLKVENLVQGYKDKVLDHRIQASDSSEKKSTSESAR
jgi:hypothetical protein